MINRRGRLCTYLGTRGDGKLIVSKKSAMRMEFEQVACF